MTDITSIPEAPHLKRLESQGKTLEKFIETALGEAAYTPNDPPYTMLVLWGHAYDFAIGRETKADGTIEALDFDELAQVLERLRTKFTTPEGKLDILGFDACDASTVEIACQLEPFAKYLLASQIGIPIPGWPYDRILDRLLNVQGDRRMGPAEFGSYVVRRFCESYDAASDAVSLTLLDLGRAVDLSAFGEYLAVTLARAVGDPDERERISDLFSQSQTAVGKPYVDVADLCLGLVRSSDDPLIVEAATKLGDFLMSPALPVVGNSATGRGRPFVVDHGRNAGLTARLNGISIYAPHVAAERDFAAVRESYENFLFAQNTYWSALVHALAEES